MSAFYLHLEVADRPGVLAQVAQILGMQGVSIKSVVQKGLGENARLVMVVHPVLESRFFAAVELIGALDFLRSPPRAIRVIEEEFAELPGLIERYRDRLPFDAGDPVITLGEGSTPLVHAPRRLRARRRGGLAEARGRQPDRLLQGPRHDLRGVGRRARGRRGRHLRLDRQHRRERRRLRGARRAHAAP